MHWFFWVYIGSVVTSSVFGADLIQQRLDQLYAEYEQISNNPTIEKYIKLDGNLREFTRNMPGWRFKVDKYEDFYKYDNERTLALGLETGKYTQKLQYSGKFLVVAHEMDPRSGYRNYTFFSQIMGTRPSHGLGEMPNIRAAYQYTREFPDGPFVSETFLIIANFHKDLYMVIRDLSGSAPRNHKHICFQPFVEKRPYAEQMDSNKKIAIRYYTKFTALNPDLEGGDTGYWIDQLKAGTVDIWSFCAD